MATTPTIKGLLNQPKTTANGKLYRGRFTCADVQWIGDGPDTLATFAITAGELADAASSHLLWTDQDVQRGIVPTAPDDTAKELSLADGYPDPQKYIFNVENADDIAEKLLRGDQVFLSPLVWNLRPGSFAAYWDEPKSDLYIYEGKCYIPDAHHRQQAIIKAVKLWRDNPGDYKNFSDSKEFKVELYFLSREDEGNYFFDKNQRPRPTSKSKSYDLTTHDDLSVLAKFVVDRSVNLAGNVNRVTDRLAANNPQVVTLSTIRNMMRIFAGSLDLDGDEVEGLAQFAAEFYDMLAEVRPELGHQDVKSRRAIRKDLLVDSATVMHAYANLARDYYNDVVHIGTSKAKSRWRQKIQRLSSSCRYSFDDWSGDLFEKSNPLWLRIGVVKAGRTEGKVTAVNNGAAQSSATRALRQLLAVEPPVSELRFLVQR
ncbi:DNA sulfur modification protein DndB [Brevundimonas sp.]|uniref:DNA sulfur modification protein DndB n=1 Tax=Brevundimonas sp. TaxID=1871086 RepID=UPI0035B18A7D